METYQCNALSSCNVNSQLPVSAHFDSDLLFAAGHIQLDPSIHIGMYQWMWKQEPKHFVNQRIIVQKLRIGFIQIDEMGPANSTISPLLTFAKASQIATELLMSKNDFKVSYKWLICFRTRKGLYATLLHGEGGEARYIA